MANNFFLKCSISFTTREMQIRGMLKFHPVPIQIAKTKLRKRKRNDFEQFSGFEQKGTFTQCWWERKIVPASVEIGVDVHQAAK